MNQKSQMQHKFIGNTYRKYMGLDVEYKFIWFGDNIIVDMTFKGDFKLPIICKHMFKTFFDSTFVQSYKYFGVKMSELKNYKLGTIKVNDMVVGDSLILSDSFTKDLETVFDKHSKRFSVVFSDYLGSYLIKLEGVGNKITYKLEMSGVDDIQLYIYISDSDKLLLNGNVFTKNSVQDFIDTVPSFKTLNFDVDTDYIFHILSSSIYQESIDREMQGNNYNIIESFYEVLMSNNMDYDNSFAKEISVLSSIYLKNYDGMVSESPGNYPEDFEEEMISMFNGWLETNKGKYKI